MRAGLQSGRKSERSRREGDTDWRTEFPSPSLFLLVVVLSCFLPCGVCFSMSVKQKLQPVSTALLGLSCSLQLPSKLHFFSAPHSCLLAASVPFPVLPHPIFSRLPPQTSSSLNISPRVRNDHLTQVKLMTCQSDVTSQRLHENCAELEHFQIYWGVFKLKINATFMSAFY